MACGMLPGKGFKDPNAPLVLANGFPFLAFARAG
jgi:hypothetical protein